jgi:hypothetical protein
MSGCGRACETAQNLAATLCGYGLDTGNMLRASVVISPTVLLGSAFTLPAGAGALTAAAVFSLTMQRKAQRAETIR